MKVCTTRDFEIPNELLITINEHPRAKRARERELMLVVAQDQWNWELSLLVL